MGSRFIPIDVYSKNIKDKVWYIDVGNMSYSQLVELKEELKWTRSIRYIDSVIYDNISDVSRGIYNNKQRKRDEKNNNKIIKRKRRSFKRGR